MDKSYKTVCQISKLENLTESYFFSEYLSFSRHSQNMVLIWVEHFLYTLSNSDRR